MSGLLPSTVLAEKISDAAGIPNPSHDVYTVHHIGEDGNPEEHNYLAKSQEHANQIHDLEMATKNKTDPGAMPDFKTGLDTALSGVPIVNRFTPSDTPEMKNYAEHHPYIAGGLKYGSGAVSTVPISAAVTAAAPESALLAALAHGTTMAGIGGADKALDPNASWGDVATNAGVSGALGALGPLLGAGLSRGTSQVASSSGPEMAATRRSILDTIAAEKEHGTAAGVEAGKAALKALSGEASKPKFLDNLSNNAILSEIVGHMLGGLPLGRSTAALIATKVANQASKSQNWFSPSGPAKGVIPAITDTIGSTPK